MYADVRVVGMYSCREFCTIRRTVFHFFCAYSRDDDLAVLLSFRLLGSFSFILPNLKGRDSNRMYISSTRTMQGTRVKPQKGVVPKCTRKERYRRACVNATSVIFPSHLRDF